MNRLDLLIRQWKSGTITDPDLSLCLQILHSQRMDARNAGTPENIEGINNLLGEGDITEPKRLKAKRLRPRI